MTAQFAPGQPLHVAFPMLDAADPLAFKPTLTVAVAAWAHDGTSWDVLAIADTAAEIGASGVYEITLSGSETAEVSQILLKATAPGAAATAMLFCDLSAQLNRIEAQTAKITTGAIQVISPVSEIGALSLRLGDDDAARWTINYPVANGAELRTFLQGDEISEVWFCARLHAVNDLKVEVDPSTITAPDDAGTILIPLTILRGSKPRRTGDYACSLLVVDANGYEHHETIGALTLLPQIGSAA